MEGRAGGRTQTTATPTPSRAFESAAAQFPAIRLPAGVAVLVGRAHEALKNTALADARYALVATDYLNSYYGRLAVAALDGPRRP